MTHTMDDHDETSDWGDTDGWDDDDYDEFIEREFPGESERRRSSPGGVSAIWKWTAWLLLAAIVFFWVWSLRM